MEISISINGCIIVPEFVYNYYLIKNNLTKNDDIVDIEEKNEDKEMDYKKYLDNNENIINYEKKHNDVEENNEIQLSNREINISKGNIGNKKTKKMKSKRKKK